MKKIIIFLFVTLSIALSVKSAKAARLYLDPAEGNYGPGDSVEVNIRIDVDKACVNTVEAELAFPKNTLEFKDFITGDSILSIWVERPATADAPKINESGNVYFAGGIPGGYCGKIPGDPGDSNIIGRLAFVVLPVTADSASDKAELAFTDRSRVLINDGLGTEDELLKQAASFKIENVAVNRSYDWKSRISSDTIPPEPFVLELRHDKNMFDGAYYLTFSTVDKQTGVDHYAALELKADEQEGVKPKGYFWDKWLNRERVAPLWQGAKTPYVLHDQSLTSIIKVKAVDKAGNERVVQFTPETYKDIKPDNSLKIVTIVVSLIIFLLMALLAAYLIIRRRKKKNNLLNREVPADDEAGRKNYEEE